MASGDQQRARRHACLRALGIEPWVLRAPTAGAVPEAAAPGDAVSIAQATAAATPPRQPGTRGEAQAASAAEPAPERRPDAPGRVAAGAPAPAEPAHAAPAPAEPAHAAPPVEPAAASTPTPPRAAPTRSVDEPPAWQGPEPPDFGDEPPPPEPLPQDLEAADFFDPELDAPAVDPVGTLDWPGLEARVAECSRCPELVGNRSRTVFGVGNREAALMVIGEAPGADEDRQGEPFVGRAGKLLDQMLAAIGQPRAKVFIANVLKCRPPNNRDPHPDEAAACRPFLQRQMELVNPRMVLVVGRIAAQTLLQTEEPIGRLRGRLHTLPGSGLPAVVTYHPAYLLRSPAEKRKAWADLRMALHTLRADS